MTPRKLDRRELLHTLRELRERAALDGYWLAFEMWDHQIRRITEAEKWHAQSR
jgi:hypothetical protein